MLGFTVRHKSNNWTIIGVNYSDGIVVIHDPEYNREESVPMDSLSFVYRTPDPSGDVRYYGPEYIIRPFSILPDGQSWRTYYLQSSGARFIGEDLIDSTPEYRAEQWAKGIPYVY